MGGAGGPEEAASFAAFFRAAGGKGSGRKKASVRGAFWDPNPTAHRARASQAPGLAWAGTWGGGADGGGKKGFSPARTGKHETPPGGGFVSIFFVRGDAGNPRGLPPRLRGEGGGGLSGAGRKRGAGARAAERGPLRGTAGGLLPPEGSETGGTPTGACRGGGPGGENAPYGFTGFSKVFFFPHRRVPPRGFSAGKGRDCRGSIVVFFPAGRGPQGGGPPGAAGGGKGKNKTPGGSPHAPGFPGVEGGGALFGGGPRRGRIFPAFVSRETGHFFWMDF